jgi:hypothetical protein
MRLVLPSTEYRLIKNRKCAREARKKRKEINDKTVQELQISKKENQQLWKQIALLEARLNMVKSKT